MCNCERELKVKLTEKLVEMYPDAKDHLVNLPDYALILSNPSRWVGKMRVDMSVVAPMRKNSEVYKVKKVKHSLFFSYCPFCGERCDGTTKGVQPEQNVP